MPVDFEPLAGGNEDPESGQSGVLKYSPSKLLSPSCSSPPPKLGTIVAGCAGFVTFILACVAVSSANDNTNDLDGLTKQVKALQTALAKDESTLSDATGSIESIQGVQSSQSASISSLSSSVTGLQCTDYIGLLPGGDIQEFDGHYYQLVTVPWHIENQYATGVTFHDAQLDAAARCYGNMRGYLATISSADEQAFLVDMIPEDLQSSYSWLAWLGGTDESSEGKWIWVDGPEQGTQFWQGSSSENGGYAVNGAYTNW